MIEINPDVTEICRHLTQGDTVALPTETVYGIAIALNSPTALEKLIRLKHREIGSGKVFTLVPAAPADIQNYAMLTPFTEKLIKKYFPGELTLILHKNPAFRHPYFNHFKTIGTRIPRTPLFKELLQSSGPLLLTSANLRGAAPALTSEEVKTNLPKIDVLVTGRAGGDLPSTVLDCTVNPATTLRQGKLVFRY